jgi:hypothetical protein
MKTATRGNAAEAQVLAALVTRGFDVLTPFGGGQPFDLVPGHLGRLRLEPPKNNQRRGVRFAAEFEIDRWGRKRLEALLPATHAPAA